MFDRSTVFWFIQVAAIESGFFTDFSKMAKRAKISLQSVTRHYEILEDTMIAARLDNDPALDPDDVDFVRHPKSFFFDLGVLNATRGSFAVNRERIGVLFEQMVFQQISNAATTKALDFSFHNFRTRGGLEVDFVLNLEGKKTAIECKASDTVSSSELNPLREISRYYKKIAKVAFFRGERELKDWDIWILPLEKGMRSLFSIAP